MKKLREKPFAFGGLYGVAAFFGLKFALELLTTALFGQKSSVSFGVRISSLVFRGSLDVLPVFLLGGVGGVLWVAKRRGDFLSARRCAWQALLLLLFLGAKRAWFLADSIAFLSRSSLSSRLTLGPVWLPWQARISLLGIMLDVPLLASVSLLVVAKILTNRLAHEQKRAQQFVAPAESP